MNLRTPGPTPLPDSVLEAMGGQMINHRGPEFAEIAAEIAAGLKTVFATRHDVVVLTCSGTGGLEAAVVNTLSPGERTVVISIGVFGDRVAEIASAYGADVALTRFEQGQAADPAKVREVLAAEPDAAVVFVTHNETSTGVTNDLEALAAVIKGEFDRTLVVDGVSSIGSIPCPVDDWGIDVAVSGSQKGWMAPPGLAMVSVSPRGRDVIEKASMPRFYLDLVEALRSADLGQTPWTPALSVLYGLREGLRLILDRGVEQVHAAHAHYGALTRRLVQQAGLELFADPRHASNTVTSVRLPDGVSWKELSAMARRDYGVDLAGGQGPLSGKIFRIGTSASSTTATSKRPSRRWCAVWRGCRVPPLGRSTPLGRGDHARPRS